MKFRNNPASLWRDIQCCCFIPDFFQNMQSILRIIACNKGYNLPEILFSNFSP